MEKRGSQLKAYLEHHIFPDVQSPMQYLGGELHSVCKDHDCTRGKLCFGFPDTYAIGMSHHGLQILYSLMNARKDWLCERVFAPQVDMEQALRRENLPLFSLESFTPLCEFDVFAVTLQYEVCYTNLLTMLDLGNIPLHAINRTLGDPLVVAGGPCTQNPEPIAPFIDIAVTGDGEPSLPEICDRWLQRKEEMTRTQGILTGPAGQKQREQILADLARELPYAYVPRFYSPEYHDDGRYAKLNRATPEIPETIQPSVISDLDSIPLPIQPIVPFIECIHDRIAIEIMRGCPWQCRFCQSTVIKRPLRIRSVDTIVNAAVESYHNTGFNEISLLSLSTSDYPHFEALVQRMQEVFRPLGVNVSVPSLRVNDQLKSVAALLPAGRRKSLTLAPEVARDDMREQVKKRIKNQDLYDGCRVAFENGYTQVKLYFMCGLPGERAVDLDGIVDMAETIARIGKETTGRYPKVTASVSNFVPKAHTPYQWNGMQNAEYFRWAHQYLYSRRRLRAVHIKCHHIETSLLEGALSRGDRRMSRAIEIAWRNGSRLDSWQEHMNAARWWSAMEEAGIDINRAIHAPYELSDRLPWDHVNVKYGRDFLEKEQRRATVQLDSMAEAL